MCCFSGKNHPWTNASVGGNFRKTFRTIGPYEFPQEKVWTNDWSICISPEISRMDQWRSKFSESFSLDWYQSIECSSLLFPRLKSLEKKQPIKKTQRFLTHGNFHPTEPPNVPVATSPPPPPPPKIQSAPNLADRNLPKIRSLDSFSSFFLSDNSIRGR